MAFPVDSTSPADHGSECILHTRINAQGKMLLENAAINKPHVTQSSQWENKGNQTKENGNQSKLPQSLPSGMMRLHQVYTQ